MSAAEQRVQELMRRLELHGAQVTCGKCGKRVETGKVHACTGMLQTVA